MINKEKYEEYRESLLNIARLTNKENSILINFNIQSDVCTNIVSFIQQDGTKDILKNSTFECDEEFYKDFLEKFIKSYYSTMVVAFNDSIDINADGKYTFRVITDDNDMLSVDGISLDYANYLASIVKRVTTKDVLLEDNEKGVTTALAALIIIGGMGLAFLIMTIMLS